MPSLSSVMEIEGRCFTKRRKRKKNNEKLPNKIAYSMREGEYSPHALGIKSWAAPPMMITKRSNHMPMLIRMDMLKSQGMLLRTFLKKKSRGATELQITMIQNCRL